MKKLFFSSVIAVLLCTTICVTAQASDSLSVADNEYFVVGLFVGFVEDYVPGSRPILDTYTFSPSIFSAGTLTISGFNEALGTYTIEEESFGFEKVSSTCFYVDLSNDLAVTYDIKIWNASDISILGVVTLESVKNFEDAGTAVGFFIGVQKII
jgi:hypothetical protein